MGQLQGILPSGDVETSLQMPIARWKANVAINGNSMQLYPDSQINKDGFGDQQVRGSINRFSLHLGF